MPYFDYNSQSKNYTKLNKRLAGYIKEIQLIFQQLNHEGCKIALDLTDILDNLDKVLDFSKYPQTKDRLNKLMTKYQKGISSVVVSSMQAEYKKGELDQDTLANNLIERCNTLLPKNAPKLSNKDTNIITSSTDKAKDSFLNRANRGFNLKSKLALQSKEYIKELESAISVAIGKGMDAKTLSKQVTNLFLDYAKLDKEYKLKFGEPIPSKNIQYQAMRLARSEINMAYRDAEQARWRDMPFVLGYEIVLSNNHNCKGVPKGHFYDICDELAGKYPKDFKWLGWHPNCRCHAVPIMMTDEQFIKWNNGKQVNAPTIDKMPKQFDKWLEENKDRIERATQRGTLPYFLTDNGVIKGGKFTFSLPIKNKSLSILEKAEIRHNNRTPEQIKAIQQRWDARRKENAIINKTANNLLKVAKNYPEVDITPITESIYSKQSIRRFANKTVAKEILKAKKDDIFLSNLIPNVRTWKKQFNSTELHSVYNAVESKLKQWDSLSLEDKLKKIDFEIKYLANPSLYKAGAMQYPTWEVAQSAYQKQLHIIHYEIDIKSIKNNLSAAKKWSIAHPHSHKVANLLNEVDDLITLKSDLVTIQQKAQLAQVTYNKRLKEQAYRDKKKGKISTSTDTPFTADAYTEERKNAAVWAQTSKEADDVLRDKCGEIWQSLNSDEKDAIFGYTESYCNINEPLRGVQYIGSPAKTQEGLDRIPLIEKVIDRSSYDFDIWLQRGDNMISLKKFGLSDYYNASDNDILNLVGKEGTEGAFWSAAVAKGKGFNDKPIIFNIYAPKGTKMMYCEPFSSFGSGNGRAWNGIDKQHSFGHESEIIIQRGTKYRITKVEKDNKQWYIDVEVIAQDLVEFPYTNGYPFL